MPYTEATLLEVQRLASVVPLFSRASIQDQYVGKYFIPKVAQILILPVQFRIYPIKLSSTIQLALIGEYYKLQRGLWAS